MTSRDAVSAISALIDKYGFGDVETACVDLGIGHGPITYNVEGAVAASGLAKSTIRLLYSRDLIPTRNYNSLVLIPAHPFKRFLLEELPSERRFR